MQPLATQSGNRATRPLTRNGAPHYAFGKSPDSNLAAVSLQRMGIPLPPCVLWAQDSRHLVTHQLDERSVGVITVLQHVPPEDIVDGLRMIKSPYEIGRMVYAGQVASAGMKNLLSGARPDQTLLEVYSEGNRLIFGMPFQDEPTLNPLATRVSTAFQPARFSHDPPNFGDMNTRMAKGGPHVSLTNAVMNG